jgi:hypothetical protein
MKMCEDFALNFGDKKNWLLHHNNALSHTCFFAREFLTKSNMTFGPTHPTFLFPQLKMKLKGRHFDTIEVINAESQTVLNTLTEHNFQNTFKKWLKRWEWCIRVEGTYLKGESESEH